MKNKIFGFAMLIALIGTLSTSCGSLPKAGQRPGGPPGAPARP
ncbi:hypothetical protein [Mucilaginibacter antarcticus]|uniref:Lipoprotein n=1 Tax=Mucilaginibacter antarcticus TaxID=1855725 RepID=A0ABW5XRG5_9SPHI